MSFTVKRPESQGLAGVVKKGIGLIADVVKEGRPGSTADRWNNGWRKQKCLTEHRSSV